MKIMPPSILSGPGAVEHDRKFTKMFVGQLHVFQSTFDLGFRPRAKLTTRCHVHGYTNELSIKPHNTPELGIVEIQTH